MSNSCERSYPLASSSRRRRRLALQLADRQQSALGSVRVPATMRGQGLLQPVIVPADEFVRIEIYEDPNIRSAGASQTPQVARLRPPEVSAQTEFEEHEPGVNFQSFQELLAGSKPAAWVFAGDSVTLGARHTDGQRSYSEHFAEEIRAGLGRHHDVVINTAALGETAQSLLDDLEWRTLRFKPDVVSVMIGINDAAAGPKGRTEFRRNLEHIVACIRAESALVLLHTPPRIDHERVTTHGDLRAYVRLLREISRELDVPRVDHWAFWKETAAEGENIGGWLAADGLHPTAAGHCALTQLLFRRLGILKETAKRAR
jgi:acyl-CoA thioesterase I